MRQARSLRVVWLSLGIAAVPSSGCTKAVPPVVASRAPAPTAAPGLAQAGLARYVAVHVDHLESQNLKTFASARQRWLHVLTEHATTDGRGLFIQTGDSGFLSLRPLQTLGDLDRSPSLIKAALSTVDPQAQKTYDDASDALLVPPHRNEIWRYDADLSLAVTDPIAALSGAAWGKMVVEEIDPSPKGEDYERAWPAIRDALTQESYPLTRVTYWSRYGSGHLVSFWLAKSQQEFLETKSALETVKSALGAERAEGLFDRQHKAVLASDSIDVIPRVDLSSAPL